MAQKPQERLLQRSLIKNFSRFRLGCKKKSDYDYDYVIFDNPTQHILQQNNMSRIQSLLKLFSNKK